MCFYTVIFFLVPIFSTLLPVESAKILGIFPLLSKSHHSINQPIVKSLAKKGHEVTILGHFQSSDNIPNYKEILISETEKLKDWVDTITMEDSVNYAGVQNWIKIFFTIESLGCDKILRLEYIKKLINSKDIDLIMTEIYHVQCFHLLAHKLNVPLILVLPPTSEMVLDYFVGNPFIPSITPLRDTKFTTKMNFWQRFENAFQYALSHWRQNNNIIYKKDMERYARDILNIELPTDEELNRRTALAFYNNHPSFISRPMSPNVIDIAGIHIKEPRKLPKDVEEFIEGAVHGVILFSFGTTMKASSITPEKLKAIKDTFAAIPQRILWRVNDLNITDVSPNVMLGEWFPQRDVLEHKKVIAFISHGGLFGTFEAIHTATPIIGIPFIFDQFQNVNLLVEREVGIHVDYFSMDKNILIDAIKEITTNTKYRENIMKWSKIFKDRPMSPLDEAVYWTEYVIKHQGAPHLRTTAADMPLYQYLLLDVLVVLLGFAIGFAYFLRYFLKILISFLCSKKLKKYKTT
ncbi:UDP-glucosyltransferase 2-like [Planococcus citri]|uniref:UDP-glucosyltransferase 2-like n=1 Tax=Planococcus citri TaxID=170843 RepID=UPI0031F834CF